ASGTHETTTPPTTSKPTNNPTTPPSTTDPTSPLPPPPPNILEESFRGCSSNANPSKPSYSFLVRDTSLYLSAEAPEGMTVSFGQTKINTEFGKEWDIGVRIDADETAPPGDYDVPITVSTAGGREATATVTVTVMSYIDVVFEELTFFPETPEDGQEVTFEATIRNDGDRPSGTLTVVLYEEATNVRLAAQCVELEAYGTVTIPLTTTASDTMGNVKAFVSSPSHEQVITNNYAYACVNVCLPENPPRSAQDIYDEALNLYEDELWDAAAAGFSNSADAFEAEGDPSRASQATAYMERAQTYSLAQQLYDEAKEAEAQGNYELAEEKYKAAEELYTELEDRPKINACFSKILGLGASDGDGGNDYPWYVFIVPLAALIMALGIVARGQSESRAVRDAEWDMLYRDLRDKYESGAIGQDTYEELLQRWDSRRGNRDR
ncbi:MAG TPA: hypothetical protein ENN11_02810, partial [Methanomicrobia archaeon]|nr:hypothetical protein [Methanomicrobia archaeon]